jgi:hypothetical protein
MSQADNKGASDLSHYKSEFKHTLRKIPNMALIKRFTRAKHDKNAVMKQLEKNKKNFMNMFTKLGRKIPPNINSRMQLLILRNTYIPSLIYRIQKKYQTIMNTVLANHTKKTYDKEITLFMYGHGMDIELKNHTMSPDCDDLFRNVRIFGLKKTNREYPAAMHVEDENEQLRLYYNLKNIVIEMLMNDCFGISMKDRERLIEAIFKIHFAFFPNDFLTKYAKKISSIQRFVNPEVGHFRPVMDHIWSIEYDASINSGDYPSGTFLVVNSTIPEDINNTCRGNFTLDVNREGISLNHLLRDPYWVSKLNLDIIMDKPSGKRYIVLSDLIWKLKRAGYEKIHIMDVSCRNTDLEYPKSHSFTISNEYLQQIRSDYDDPPTMGIITNKSSAIHPVSNPSRNPILRRKPKLPPTVVSTAIQRQRVERERTCGIENKRGGADAETNLPTNLPTNVKRLPFSHESLLELLNADLQSTHSLEHTNMYKIYNKIIPNTPLLPNRRQTLYVWYLMILLGHVADECEREEECLLILKGGKSIQLLVDGNYDSTDIDIKILDIETRSPGAKSKQKIAEELALRLTQGLEKKEISILYPKGNMNNTLYKISFSDNTGFIPLVDIDFKELVCSAGKETEMECRLKRIFSRTETHPIFIDNLPFIQNETLNYNTYPVTIQIKEKTVLINEYKEMLMKGINKDITTDTKLIIELMELFISFKLARRGEITAEMMTKIAEKKYTEVIQTNIFTFISLFGLDPVFYIQKFVRGLEGLLRNNDKLRKKTLEIAKEAVVSANQRIKRIKEYEENMVKQRRLYASAVHQTALIAATKRLHRLEQIEKNKDEQQRRLYSSAGQQAAIVAATKQLEQLEKLERAELKRAEEELEMKQYFDAEDEKEIEEIYEDATNNNSIETNQNRFNRTRREMHRKAYNQNAKEMVESNLEKFVKERNEKLQRLANPVTKKRRRRKPSSVKAVGENSNSNGYNLSMIKGKG